MQTLTDEQIRATVAAMRAAPVRTGSDKALDALERAALAGDGPTLVVLRVQARRRGVVA
jgi:hypothetical protein